MTGDKLTTQEQRDYEACCNQIRAGEQDTKRGMLAMASALTEVRDRRLYRHQYKTFAEFCETEFGWSPQWGNRVIKASGVWQNLLSEENGNLSFHSEDSLPNVNQAASLAQLPPEEQGEAYQEAKREAAADGKEAPSTKQVKASVQKRKSAAGTPLQAPAKVEKPKYLKHLEQAERLHGDLGSALYAACNENDDIKKGWFEPILKNLHRKIQEAKRV